MKKSNKKGFTIVELVIVIAVIAILAAVLIPTFSGLVKKANLSSDMQAVRQMNTALANAQAINGKPKNIDEAMKVIADAGYDVNSWKPLTAGYEVYWYKTDNVCILYNASKAAVEFPKDYTAKSLASDIEFASNLYIYNQTYIKSSTLDFKANSTVETINGAEYTVSEIKTGATATTYSSVVLKENNSTKQATFEIKNTIANGASNEEIKAAQVAAGDNILAIFTQIDLNVYPKDTEIKLAPGTVIDISDKTWDPIELYSGKFGTDDENAPVEIKGLKLTDAVGYAKTYKFLGSDSMYYCSGFFGAIYGNCTIQNVKFTDVEIETPANDCIITRANKNSNTTAIIGGIVRPNDADGATNVTIKNVTCENCKITGASRVGGLIGYIGGYKDAAGNVYGLNGSVTLERCTFNGEVVSKHNINTYGTAGALIGFMDKMGTDNNLVVNVENCTVGGTVKGFVAGGILGEVRGGPKEINITDVTSTVEITLNSSLKDAKASDVIRIESDNAVKKVTVKGRLTIGGESITAATEKAFDKISKVTFAN